MSKKPKSNGGNNSEMVVDYYELVKLIEHNLGIAIHETNNFNDDILHGDIERMIEAIKRSLMLAQKLNSI